jgi:hypothetical protein
MDVKSSDLKNYSFGLTVFLGVTGIALVLIGALSGNSGGGVDLGMGLGVFFVVSAFVALAMGKKPVHVQPQPFMTALMPDGERQRMLQNRLSKLLASEHGRIDSTTPYAATVITGQKVNHILHLLISALLCGLWLPVWFFISLSGGEKRQVLIVDPCGNVYRAG